MLDHSPFVPYILRIAESISRSTYSVGVRYGPW